MTTPSADLIDAYLVHLRQLDRSPRTIAERRRILTQADAELPVGLEAADEHELRTWLYRDGWLRSTKATYLTALRSFYRWAVDLAPHAIGLHTNPTVRLERPRPPRGRPRPVTDEQLGQLLARCVEPYRLWVLLAAYAGLRCIEISRLDREHVTEHTITVAGKGDQAGTVPTHPHIWAAVRHLPPGPLVLDRHGRRMRERTLSTRFSHYARLKLGLPVSMHQMRHWAGTECQRAVGDVRVTQEFLRHESITSTMIYTQVSDRQLVAAVNSLPTIGAGPNGASPPDAPAAGPTPPPPAD